MTWEARVETRRLGRLGHLSSVLVYGGAALAEVPQDVADRSLQQALDAGVNHIDVSANYGAAELRVGAWLPPVRDRVFLATKTGQRTAAEAWAEITRSLQRLRTDRVDLLQLHAVGDLAELDLATGPGGALEAAVRAQQEGLVGALGITGHGPQAPATHLAALRRFPFATVITPLNPALWADPEYRADYLALVAEAQRQDVGLMTIKTLARRNWPGLVAGQSTEGQAYATWYEPFDDPVLIRAAVSWVLSHREVTGLCTTGDVRLLAAIIAAERDRMDPDEALAVLQRVPGYASPFLVMPW